MIRTSSIFIKLSFILGISVLILSLSKEGIIHSSFIILCSGFITFIFILGGLLTWIYSIGFYVYVFMIFELGLYYDYYYYSGFIFMIYVMCCIFIDQSFELCFLLSSLYSLFYIFNFECLFCYSLFIVIGSSVSLIYYFIMLCTTLILIIIYYYSWYSMIRIYIFSFIFIINYCFDSRSSFIFSYYYYVLYNFSFFIYIPFIYCIELFVSYKSYSLWIFIYYHFSILYWVILGWVGVVLIF